MKPPKSSVALLETVTAELGPLYALVHNAGGDIAAAGGKPDPNDAIWVKEVDVRAVIDRNLLSTIFMCQQAARGMMERREGRIVTVSSIGAYGGRVNGAIYGSAKAAAIHYTRCLAAQLRPFNVTANSIAPGGTRTARFLATRDVPARSLPPSRGLRGRRGYWNDRGKIERKIGEFSE